VSVSSGLGGWTAGSERSAKEAAALAERAVQNVKAQAYRDTRGPGLDAYKALLVVARAQPGAKGLRDVALVRLLHDLGLRRGEAVRLDAFGPRPKPATDSWCSSKACSQKEPVTLPPPTKAALEAWLQARGTEDGPLGMDFATFLTWCAERGFAGHSLRSGFLTSAAARCVDIQDG
jgi:hypothetical protein